MRRGARNRRLARARRRASRSRRPRAAGRSAPFRRSPSGSKRRASFWVSWVSARTASFEPSMLRSSSTWPTVMTIGSNAAVMRSPVAQAATRASAMRRSVMPCRLGWRRLSQAAVSTGTATSAAAAPAIRSATPRSEGSRKYIPLATISRQSAASAIVQPQRKHDALGAVQQGPPRRRRGAGRRHDFCGNGHYCLPGMTYRAPLCGSTKDMVPIRPMIPATRSR